VKNYIRRIGEKVLEGEKITFTEAKKLLDADRIDIVDLMAVANRVRHNFIGDKVDLCSLLNAKSGRCSEDCKFCAQSAREAANRIRQETKLHLDCSLGIITEDQAKALRNAGVERYNHNLETAPSFFEKICTTHSFSERLETLHHLKFNGFSLCSGGIIGLGETPEQWLELVFLLRDLEVDCIPVNILNPRPGTPLENMIPPPPLEILKIIAIMRLIVPQTHIKIAGGREVNLRDLQATAFLAGATGIIIGGYLTTKGRSQEDDFQMLKDLELSWEEER